MKIKTFSGSDVAKVTQKANEWLDAPEEARRGRTIISITPSESNAIVNAGYPYFNFTLTIVYT